MKDILAAWESFARAIGYPVTSSVARSAFLAGYTAGSAEQLESAEDNYRHTAEQLRRIAQIELASAKPTGATQ